MAFKTIQHISDIKEKVAEVKEIRFSERSNGTTIVSYNIADSRTFSIPEALECRGITFAKDGTVASRPLHKFFNLGEKDDLRPDTLVTREDIIAIFDKLDGSMICTANVDGQLEFKSQKSFDSDVAKLANNFLSLPENSNYLEFCTTCIQWNCTAIFEFQHPDARIVVAVPTPRLTLLHIRDNITGEYLLLNSDSVVHNWIAHFCIPLVNNRKSEFSDTQAVLDSLTDMKEAEGYVIQFANGDMVKIKCPWYIHLHHNVTFLRERDIARMALHNELDDVKEAIIESGINLEPILAVETRVKNMILAIEDAVDNIVKNGKHLNIKDFAIQYNGHPYFGLIMSKRRGSEIDYISFFERNYLKTEFSSAILADTQPLNTEGRQHV
jgi:RNA ligase